MHPKLAIKIKILMLFLVESVQRMNEEDGEDEETMQEQEERGKRTVKFNGKTFNLTGSIAL